MSELVPDPARPSRRLVRVAGGVLLVTMLVVAGLIVALSNRGTPACRGAGCSADGTSGSPGTNPSSGPPATAGALKPLLRGLLDRDATPPPAYVGVAVRGWVVKATWRELQPTAGGPIAADNPVDRALAEVRRLNATDPKLGLGLKLRVYAGPDAPDWAKTLGGPAVSIVNPQGGQAGGGATVGRFWTEEYGRAYAELQDKLAVKYDAAPELRETVVSRCTLVYAESFIRLRGSRPSIDNLLAAGFTKALDRTCLQESIDAHRVWVHTRSDLQFAPYQDIEQRGPKAVDDAFTEELMRYCRDSLGQRCVLENNSLRYPPNSPALNAAFKALGPPISYQTAAPGRVGDLLEAIRYGIGQGAGSIELPVSYRKIDPQQFAGVDAELRQAAG